MGSSSSRIIHSHVSQSLDRSPLTLEKYPTSPFFLVCRVLRLAILVVLVLKYRYLSHCAFFAQYIQSPLSCPYSTLLPWRLARIKSSTVARPTTRSVATTLLSLPLSCLPVLQLQESCASPLARLARRLLGLHVPKFGWPSQPCPLNGPFPHPTRSPYICQQQQVCGLAR
jgi:hypothetical protein